jgi:hypothetical protein
MEDAQRLDRAIEAWETNQKLAPGSSARERVSKGLIGLRSRRKAAWR